MSKRILITGATGLIGSHICKELSDRGDILTIFTRNPDKAKRRLPYANEYVKWDYRKSEAWKVHLNSKDVVIHLAGANLSGKRWTTNYKKEIIDSRELSTQNLVTAISEAQTKPEVFICASGINYYGSKEDEILTEESDRGIDFAAKVCIKWETEASKAEQYGIRRISTRTAPVLTKEDGVLKKFLLPFKLFAGGPLGSGKQWFSWIHLEDAIRGYLFLIDNKSVNGAVNLTSPDPVRMNEFAKTLGKVLNRPALFKVPEFVLKIAVGEMSQIVTASLRVKPKKLEEHNFNFRSQKLKEALEDLLKNKRL